MGIRVMKAGLLSTLQDCGRPGYRKTGLGPGGAMDAVALQIANLLVGNSPDAAVLEMGQSGPRLCFEEMQLIALCGANLSPTLNGKPMGLWRPVWVSRGSTLAFGAPKSGRFAYLAVAGGFGLPKVLGSYSTSLLAGLGGLAGRALQAGDVLACSLPPDNHILRDELPEHRHEPASREASWWPAPELLPAYEQSPLIRVIKGPEWEWLSENSQRTFLEASFHISSRSNRMGYRLQGPQLTLSVPAEMLSSAVSFGTIQVPAAGQPLLLLADHQTTGGYPRIASVITADFSRLVQAGKSIRFTEVSLNRAHQLLAEQEQKLEKLRQVVHLKFQQHP